MSGAVPELRGDDSGKTVFIATGLLLLSLPSLLAEVLLLVADEKSDRSVSELTGVDPVLLPGAMAKGELDWKYRRIVFSRLAALMLDEDDDEDVTPPLRTPALEWCILHVPLAF